MQNSYVQIIILFSTSRCDLYSSSQDDLLPSSKLNSIICQALRQLKADRSGSEKAWFMSLVTLAKLKPELFTSDKVTDVRRTNDAKLWNIY